MIPLLLRNFMNVTKHFDTKVQEGLVCDYIIAVNISTTILQVFCRVTVNMGKGEGKIRYLRPHWTKTSLSVKTLFKEIRSLPFRIQSLFS